MKVLLVNPRTEGMISTELPGYVSKEVGHFPPLGLLYLAAHLQRDPRHGVALVDMPARDVSYEALGQRVAAERPGVAGITTTTHNLVEAKRAAECIKRASPGTVVCLGGPHVDAFPELALAWPSIDAAFRGEAEASFHAYIDALADGGPVDAIPGLIRRDGGRVVVAPPPAPPEDLDALPFPARGLLDPRDYRHVLGRRATFTTLLATRGCPFKCIFCSTPHGGCRMRSTANLVDEMESCLGRGAEELHFVDDTFNLRAERLGEVSGEILRRGLAVRWSLRARVDRVDAESLRLARRAGCIRIHYGIETGTDEGLRALRKGITVGQAERAIAWTREAGIATATYFLIGCPHERSRADVLRTIDFARRIGPDYAMFNVLAIYPHTELHAMAVAKGLAPGGEWEPFVRDPRPDFRLRFWEESMSATELTSLLRLAYRRFYLRPSVVWRQLRGLGSPGELRHKASAALALLGGRG
ncbi:MAG: radical SAM protein [Lentisphaerae bacterium]|nr:radical SAM protein [Lentisphaerota bacterium]